MGWKHYQTVDPSKRKHKVGRGLFRVHLLILYFKFQFSKSSKPSTIHIFLNLAYPFRRKICLSQNAQKSPKNLHKTAKHWSMKYAEDLALLETWLRYWQKGRRVKRRRNSLHVCTPALKTYPRSRKELKECEGGYQNHPVPHTFSVVSLCTKIVRISVIQLPSALSTDEIPFHYAKQWLQTSMGSH